MGKTLHQLTRIIAASTPNHKPNKPTLPKTALVSLKSKADRVDPDRVRVIRNMETDHHNNGGGNTTTTSSSSMSLDGKRRVPLSRVVSECAKRWFADALREAKAGDVAMQVLVSQMYHSGYGVSKDELKSRAWINKAARGRNSVWKVGGKHPGYNASDSDTDEAEYRSK